MMVRIEWNGGGGLGKSRILTDLWFGMKFLMKIPPFYFCVKWQKINLLPRGRVPRTSKTLWSSPDVMKMNQRVDILLCCQSFGKWKIGVLRKSCNSSVDMITVQVKLEQDQLPETKKKKKKKHWVFSKT